MTSSIGSHRPFISPRSPQEGALSEQSSLKREREPVCSASASSSTSSTEEPPLKKQQNSAGAVLAMVKRGLTMVKRGPSSGSPASEAPIPIQANHDVHENTSLPNQEEEDFRKKVEHHRAELCRRDSDASGSPHSRLAAAVVAMFEFDEPEIRAIKEAVISTLRDGVISRDQFFSTHKANGETVTPFDDILETIGSKFRGGATTASEDRLIKDVRAFRDLMEACHASPVEEIRAAPSAYIFKTASAFFQQALAMTPEQQRPDAGALQRMLKYVEAKADPYAAASMLLFAGKKGQFSAKIRMAFHGLGLAIAASLPDPESRAVLIGNFAGNIPLLPLEHQLDTFRNCISLDSDAPADTAHVLFESCARKLDKFDHEVGGKAAIELVEAASKAARKYGDPEVLTTVLHHISERLILRDPYANSGKSYFDSVPEDDRIEYFVSAVHAALAMPDFDGLRVSSLGRLIAGRGGLPDRMTGHAEEALYKISLGEEVNLRSEIQHW